jgi:hypothetical protein
MVTGDDIDDDVLQAEEAQEKRLQQRGTVLRKKQPVIVAVLSCYVNKSRIV